MQLEKPQKLSLVKVATVDYLAWLGFVGPLVLWSFTLVVLLIRLTGADSATLAKISAVLTLLGAAAIALRYRALRIHFERGVEVPGRIVRMANVQDIGRVVYTYTYLTKSFQTTNYFHFSMRMDRLEEQRDVTVVLNPTHPHRARIKNFYFEVQEDDEE
jgi:hypothetical protein